MTRPFSERRSLAACPLQSVRLTSVWCSSRCRALLPQYRQAPDYDTAVKQMYSGGGSGQGPGGAEPPAAYMYRSQPEIHHVETDVRTE